MYIRSFTKNMDDAIHTVRKKIGEMIICTFLSGLIVAGISIATFIVGAILVALSVGAMAVTMTESSSTIVMTCIYVFLIVVIIWAGAHIVQGAIILVTDSYHRGKKMEGVSAVGASFKKLPVYMGYVCLQIISLIPCIALAGVVIGLAMTSFRNIYDVIDFEETIGGSLILAMVIIVIGTIIVCAIALLYKTLFIFGVPAIVLDDLGPIEAFKKNMSLVKGEFKTIFKNIFVYECGLAGIGISIGMLIGTVVGTIMLIFVFLGNDIELIATQLSICEWPLRLGYSLVGGAFGPAIVSRFYFSQKCKREGEDLRMRLQQLRQSQQVNEEIM